MTADSRELADMHLRQTAPPPAPAGNTSTPSGESNREGSGPLSETTYRDSATRSVHDKQTRTYSLEEITRLSEETDEDAAPAPTARDSSEAETNPHDEVTLAYYHQSPPVEYCEPHTPPRRTHAPTAATAHALEQQSDFATERRRRRERKRWALHAAWISTVMALTAVGLAMTPGGEAWIRDTKGSVSRTQPRNDHVVARVSTPAAASIALSITVTPDEAELYLDGEPIANPAELQRPKDDAVHELRAEAPGHRALTRTLRFERDLAMVLELASVQTEATPAPTAVNPPPRRPARPRAPVARKLPPAVTAAAPADAPPALPEAADAPAEEAVPIAVDELPIERSAGASLRP
jgi:hypothetical protein